ncbi:sodium/glutamate symporter [Desulforhopalus singaporensis]|uniref:Glutamate:Na+ symporter, ESS family n=1 Tax=Desulforhopalus singaporensis TaxID=91360 RepID=A0A1H0RXK9_9BACT|nr:sodium/glutamate symporter [Desulforhopalus singaporensis]SDP34173.1 glutamate:Na+ symporter, ESS family [Desulforhopalus singaporensis]
MAYIDTFTGFNILAVVGLMLVIGVVLRAKIKVLQNFLIPAAIIGGAIGFILVNTGVIPFEPKQFVNFSMHAFIISFMSLCLTNKAADEPETDKKEYLRGSLWMSFIWAGSCGLQAVVGGLLLVAYNKVTGSSFSEMFGYIATHGFTQGPGQGLAYGKMWANLGGSADLPIVGLIYANVGFIFAFIIGVPLARFFIKQGKNANQKANIEQEYLVGILQDKSGSSMGHEKTHPANIDTLAFQLSILFICYGITFLYMKYALVHLKGLPVVGVLSSWGLFFFHGLVVATLVRLFINKIGLGHMLSVRLQKHITGAAVDVLLVASFMSVSFQVLVSYLGPIIVISIGILAATFFYIWFFGRKLSHLGPERMIAQLGCCTGATGNGLLLLRILDPDYSTGVSLELAFFNIAILFTAAVPMFVIAPNVPNMGFLSIIGYYALYTLFCFGVVWYFGSQKDTAISTGKTSAPSIPAEQ